METSAGLHQPFTINFLIKVYEGSSATIRTSVGNTRLINILKGVKQGDVLSAILFCLMIRVITYKAFHNEIYGLSIGGTKWSDLSYADDLTVVTEDKAQLIEMMEKPCKRICILWIEDQFLQNQGHTTWPSSENLQR